MTRLDEYDLERIVRETFPRAGGFSVRADLGLRANELKVLEFVHGGADPLLDPRDANAALNPPPVQDGHSVPIVDGHDPTVDVMSTRSSRERE